MFDGVLIRGLNAVGLYTTCSKLQSHEQAALSFNADRPYDSTSGVLTRTELTRLRNDFIKPTACV